MDANFFHAKESKMLTQAFDMTPMTSYGSIWLGAIALVLAVSPDVVGLLYLCDDGTLAVVKRSNYAPDGARYVGQIAPDTNPVRLAAKLAHVATHAF